MKLKKNVCLEGKRKKYRINVYRLDQKKDSTHLLISAFEPFSLPFLRQVDDLVKTDFVHCSICGNLRGNGKLENDLLGSVWCEELRATRHKYTEVK